MTRRSKRDTLDLSEYADLLSETRAAFSVDFHYLLDILKVSRRWTNRRRNV